MATDGDATAAIAQFNGQEYDGRNMVVNEARPREDRGGGGYRSRGVSSSYGAGGSNYGGDERW